MKGSLLSNMTTPEMLIRPLKHPFPFATSKKIEVRFFFSGVYETVQVEHGITRALIYAPVQPFPHCQRHLVPAGIGTRELA